MVISLIATLISQGSVEAAGRSTATANTILSGSGVPATSIGIDGDFYIDIKSMNFYGPKKNNRWPLPISLKGPAGPIGPSGIDGKNGSSTSSSGAAGTAGAQGPAGPAGPAGLAGATGPAGPTGATGSTGSVGATGPTGPTGPAGADGSSASSAISTGSITFTNLINGIAGSSASSSSFGSFAAGKLYIVDVLIYASNSDTLSYPLKITFSASTGSPTISSSYIVANGSSYRTSANKPEYSIIAKVIVNATSVGADFGLQATVICGSSTGGTSQKLTVNGDYFAREVSSIN